MTPTCYILKNERPREGGMSVDANIIITFLKSYPGTFITLLTIFVFGTIYTFYLLWKNLAKLGKGFNEFKEEVGDFKITTKSSLSALITLTKGEYATQNSPVLLTQQGENLLKDIGFNDFLNDKYEYLKDMINSEKNLKNKMECKKAIDRLFFSGQYTDDKKFKNHMANIAYDRNIQEDQILFLMSNEFEKKYFDEKFSNKNSSTLQ